MMCAESILIFNKLVEPLVIRLAARHLLCHESVVMRINNKVRDRDGQPYREIERETATKHFVHFYRLFVL